MHTSLLEILGRGLSVDCASLLTGWLNEYGYTLADPADESYKGWLDALVDDLLQGHWGAAEQKVRSRLAAEPQSMAGHMALSAIFMHQDLIDQAQKTLEWICARRPDHILSLYALGHCSERLLDEGRAIACYQDCLKLRGFLHLPLQRLAAIYAKNLQYESALEQYVTLRHIDPEVMPTHMTLGHLFLATGQYPQAIEAFGNAILMNSDALTGPDPAIEQLVQKEQFEEALAIIDTQLDQSPQRAELLSRRADLLDLMGLADEALEAYSQALRASPTNLDAAIKLAWHHANAGAFDNAARHFTQAMDVNDQIIDAYTGLAASYSLAGSLQNAMAALCSAAMLQPSASLLLVQAARTLLKAADPCLEAIDDPGHTTAILQRTFAKRVAAEPNDPASHYAAAILDMYIPDPAGAVANLTQAIQLHPTYPRASTKLILAQYALGDNQTALDQLGQTNPSSAKARPELYYKTSLLYCSKPRFAGSMMNLMHNLNQDMAEMDPAPHLRIVLENLGLLDRSEVMLDWLKDTIIPAMAGQDHP